MTRRKLGKKAKGKHADQIEDAVEKAKDAIGKLAD